MSDGRLTSVLVQRGYKKKEMERSKTLEKPAVIHR